MVDFSHTPVHLAVDCDWLASTLSYNTGSQQKLPVSLPVNVLFHCNKSREKEETETYTSNAKKVEANNLGRRETTLRQHKNHKSCFYKQFYAPFMSFSSIDRHDVNICILHDIPDK